jgi:hypothetical protein
VTSPAYPAIDTAHASETAEHKTRAGYLTASGATAITITEVDGVCTFRIGTKMLARSVAMLWIMEVDAKPVVTSARKIAGNGAGGNAAISALHQAANDLKATLTPNDVAMTRAVAATDRLDAYVDALRARGAMKEFTKGAAQRSPD